MKQTLERTVAITGVLAVSALIALMSGVTVGIVAIASPAPAGASTTPPWEPDPSSVGGLVFYNAAGDVITSGSTADSPIAAYIEGTSTIRTGDTKATLFGYLPVHGESPGEWTGEALTTSTTYPATSAPVPLNTATLPVASGVSGDETIAQLESDLPNTDTSDDGYAGMYVLRLKTSGPDEAATTTYDSADIEVSGDTWTVVYSQSAAVTTTTALQVSAASVLYGTPVRLTATVTPTGATGTVDFRNGVTLLKAVAVHDGTATLATTALPGGTDHLTATYVSNDTSSYAGSTSTSHVVSVKAHPTTTTIKASKSTITKGQALTLTATIAPAETGTVAFYDGAKKLGADKVSKGTATLSTTKLPVGTQSLKAVFSPAVAADDKASTSKIVKVSVKK